MYEQPACQAFCTHYLIKSFQYPLLTHFVGKEVSEGMESDCFAILRSVFAWLTIEILITQVQFPNI